MEPQPEPYHPGIDQNQGVVGQMAWNQEQNAPDEVAQLDPNEVIQQAEQSTGDDNSDPADEFA